MLKDLEGSLKASTNYIESHRSYTGPEGSQEYHEVRQYSSGGGGGVPQDFNLERQVQHMMPPGHSSSMLNGSSTSASSQLQSAGMVSSVQQQKQSSYTTYKVQTNQYGGSGGDRIDYQPQQQQGSRPGSRLKQNIDELDTLLDDLNNARKVSSDVSGGDYTAASSDYSYHDRAHLQDHVKKTVTTYNEYDYQSTSGGGYQPSGKPPSPSPRRRAPSGSAPLSSPTAVRKSSPGPSRRPQELVQMSTSSSSYNYSSSQQQQQQREQKQRQVYPERPVAQDGTPTGVSYYTKYHSAHSHQSQGSGPVSFPTKDSGPRIGVSRTQSPPKRVDELMTELSEFDSSITHTGFVEPAERAHSPPRKYREPSPEPYRPPPPREASPVRKQQSTPGPAVYYPPGDMYSSSKSRTTTVDAGPPPATLETSTQHKSLYDGKSRPQSAASSRKDRDRGADGDGKSGAAVVPICLPLCCAAPCVIM